jgi:hypothetical protein
MFKQTWEVWMIVGVLSQVCNAATSTFPPFVSFTPTANLDYTQSESYAAFSGDVENLYGQITATFAAATTPTAIDAQQVVPTDNLEYPQVEPSATFENLDSPQDEPSIFPTITDGSVDQVVSFRQNGHTGNRRQV